MRYSKPPLSFEQQADLLLGRGLAADRQLLIERLSAVNYYRLSAYWHPFVNPDDTFAAGTDFAIVWDRYVFDRKLRLLVMDAIERIEVAVRTQLAYFHSIMLGNPFAYVEDASSLPGLDTARRQQFLDQIQKDYDSSREEFVNHFKNKYGDMHDRMPAWMAVEIMTFGCVLTFFRGAAPNVRQPVAAAFGIHDNVLQSWLMTLNTVRNICAHHGRLWNRGLGTKPLIPNRDVRWRQSSPFSNNRIYAVLTICRHCLLCSAPQSHWADRLLTLLQQHPAIPLNDMGFPTDWQTSVFWQGMGNQP